MRGLTTQPASEIRFFLNARDGGQERMVSVVDYLKGELFPIPVPSSTDRFTRTVWVHCSQAPASLRAGESAVCLFEEVELITRTQYGNKNYLP